jgi:prevent-host-death family protein
MLDIARDIKSLSQFKRHTGEVMKDLKKTGHPVVLTVNGKAEMVVQDAAAYQQLMELAAKAEMMEFLEESRKEIDAGMGVPAIEALEKLARKHKLGRGAK